jgi:hypothetical protein
VTAVSSIEPFLSELERLAQLVSRMPDLILREGDPGSGWSFNRRDRVIRMDGSRLRSESRDFNRGLVLHELAHAVLTRLPPYLDGAYLSRRDIYSAINAFEDIRIESWLMQRFVGARPWITEYNGKLLNNTVPEFKKLEWTQLPPLQAFLAAVMARWWHGPEQVKIPETLAPLVDEAWPHVESICKAIPGPCGERGPEAGISEVYRRSHARGLYCIRDTVCPPDPFEMEVRLRQDEFWNSFEQGILPIIKRLAPPDLASSAPRQRRMESPLFSRWSQLPSSEALESSSGEIRIKAVFLGNPFQSNGGGDGESLPWEPNLAAYLKSAQMQAAAIQRLSNLILSIFPPRRSRTWQGPRNCGARIRIRAVPQAEADPRNPLKVWERHSPPTRPIPHIGVLIDRSGSMEGERMMAALTGCVLVSEVCHRVGVPFSLFTFSNRCEQVIGWDTALDDVQRGRMGGLAKAASGGTDMADALRKAGTHMAQSPHPHRVLVVLGDGDDAADEVIVLARRITQSGVHLVGLGVGPDTAAMADCIPNARTCLHPSAIPGALAIVLEQAVGSKLR